MLVALSTIPSIILQVAEIITLSEVPRGNRGAPEAARALGQIEALDLTARRREEVLEALARPFIGRRLRPIPSVLQHASSNHS